MYVSGRSSPRIVRRRAPATVTQLEGLNFDFLKKAVSAGAQIIKGGAAVKSKATHVAGEVRKLADRVDAAGAGVQRVAQRGRDAADSIESAGRAAEGAAQGAVAGAGYGGMSKSTLFLLGAGALGVLGLAFMVGRSR